MPGHLGSSVRWTAGPTKLEFVLQGTKLSIRQDGKTLAETPLAKPLADKLKSVRELKQVGWGNGIHGKFNGQKLDGQITQPN